MNGGWFRKEESSNTPQFEAKGKTKRKSSFRRMPPSSSWFRLLFRQTLTLNITAMKNTTIYKRTISTTTAHNYIFPTFLLRGRITAKDQNFRFGHTISLASKLCSTMAEPLDSEFEDYSPECDDLDSPTRKKRNRKKEKNGNKKNKKVVDFTKIEIEHLPTVILVGRPNVGKSALYNRLIRRREALVYNTPDDHVTRDIREGVAKLGDLRFRVLDSAGLETAVSSGSVLGRTTEMTAGILSRTQFAIFLIDVRVGLQPLDLEVGKWMRKNAPGIHTILALNKSESLDDQGLLTSESAEAYSLGFGDPIGISAETGLGMVDLYEVLRPLLEEYVLQNPSIKTDVADCLDPEDVKTPLQLAIVGRPNVGKSTLLNALLQEERVLVGPESGLTRDAIRAHFKFEDRSVYLVDTAGWLKRSGQEKGPGSLSIMQSRKNLMRAHVVALVLDAEEIANARSSMKHAEVVIARQAVEEGRGLVVIVNKMDLLRKKHKSIMQEVMQVVPNEIQTVIPQISGIPVVFVSALEGDGRLSVMNTVVDTYEKWCVRLTTARLNRWLLKVMSRHSWKDQATQSRIKYFTQVKARPPTFVAFVKGKKQLSDTDMRFLKKSLKEDFELGGIPIRIMQRLVSRHAEAFTKKNSSPVKGHCKNKSDKRGELDELASS